MDDQAAVILFVVFIVVGGTIFKLILPHWRGWYSWLFYGTWRSTLHKLFWPWGYYEKQLARLEHKIDLIERENRELLKGGRKQEQHGQISFADMASKSNGSKKRIGPYEMFGRTYFMVWKGTDWTQYQAGNVLVVTKWKAENPTKDTSKYVVTTRPPKGKGEQPDKNQVCVVSSYVWKKEEEVKKDDFVISKLTDMPVEWELVA